MVLFSGSEKSRAESWTVARPICESTPAAWRVCKPPSAGGPAIRCAGPSGRANRCYWVIPQHKGGSHDEKDELKTRTDVNEDLTAQEPTESDNNLKSRRRFFAGALTTIGAGLVRAGAAGQLLDSEKSATEIRSRIVSRIQKDLAGSRADESATTYGKLTRHRQSTTKADPFEEPPKEEGGNSDGSLLLREVPSLRPGPARRSGRSKKECAGSSGLSRLSPRRNLRPGASVARSARPGRRDVSAVRCGLRESRDSRCSTEIASPVMR